MLGLQGACLSHSQQAPILIMKIIKRTQEKKVKTKIETKRETLI